MENVEIPSGALIPRSALQMLYPNGDNSSASISALQMLTLKAHWNCIGVHANATPKASLWDQFVSALEKDPFVMKLP